MLPQSKIPALAVTLVLGSLFASNCPGRLEARELSESASSGGGVAITEFEYVGHFDPVESAGAVLVSTEFVRAEFAATLSIALQGTVATNPSFVYGPGPQGFGYYTVPATQPAQARATTRATTAPRRTSSTPPRRHREFGSGRSVRLAKPWLDQFN